MIFLAYEKEEIKEVSDYLGCRTNGCRTNEVLL